MEFARFAAEAAAIEVETADLANRDQVTALLASAGDDLPIVARYVQGRVFPGWDRTTLDIGPRLLYEAIARAAGRNVTAADVESRLAELGEIGDVAASYGFGGQRGLSSFGGGGDDPLSIADVDAALRDVAGASGPGSQDAKLDRVFGLFNRCSPEEARYLARLVLSEMRIGVGGGTVRDAIAEAFDVPVEPVERALQVSNDYGLVAETARAGGVAGLRDVRLEIGRPIQSMLAQSGTVSGAFDDWGSVAVDVKFDGARVQVHANGDWDGNGNDVRLFSRNMEDVTDPLPEIVEFVEDHLVEPAILDGEVVAVDENGDPLPFQAVLRRFRRKHDVDRAREDVALEANFFDVLHAGGEDLLDRPLRERHAVLERVLEAGVTDLVITDDPDRIAAIESDAIAAGHEGVMLKDPDSTYTPGRRGQRWRKVKPDVDTLDCVVTGAEWGEGRRATFLGTFELSVRVDDTDRVDAGIEPGTADGDDPDFATVGKVATGITDGELADLTELLGPHIRAEAGQKVDVEPAIVFEVGYEEIQRSPTYTSGYALRFPRFVAVRPDKDPGDADDLETVVRLAEDR